MHLRTFSRFGPAATNIFTSFEGPTTTMTTQVPMEAPSAQALEEEEAMMPPPQSGAGDGAPP